MLFLHIATKSDLDLATAGVYKYASSPGFGLLLLSCYEDDTNEPNKAINNDLLDIKRGTLDFTRVGLLPSGYELNNLCDKLLNPSIIKVAYNANFTRVCLGRYFKMTFQPHNWYCVSSMAARLGFSRRLDQIPLILERPETKALITSYTMFTSKFCIQSAEKFHTYESPLTPRSGHSIEDPTWKGFRECINKVVFLVKQAYDKLSVDYVPEWDLYELDQRINDRGICVDKEIINNAAAFIADYKPELADEVDKILGLNVFKGNIRNKTFITNQLVSKFGESPDVTSETAKTEEGRRVLYCHEEYTKNSCDKYNYMSQMIDDGRFLRGTLIFNGTHTGRWSSGLLHNMPVSNDASTSDLDHGRALVKANKCRELATIFARPMQGLSTLLRTAIIPDYFSGHFVIVDFCNIEARILAWFAGCKWKLELFESDADLYTEVARKIFKSDEITPEQRHIGKVAELSLGYGAGPAVLASNLNMSVEEAREVWRAWHQTNNEINTLKQNIVKTIQSKHGFINSVEFEWLEDKRLVITLPSKNKLMYRGFNISSKSCMSYINTKNKETPIWEGTLIENIISGMARDVLADRLLKLHAARYKIAFHVHDEIVIETKDTDTSKILEIVNAGKKLFKAKAFISSYYRK
jgi:DNA polymerase